MGVVIDGVVVHLAVLTPAYGVGVCLPGLVTAMATVDWLEIGVEGTVKLTEARGAGWRWLGKVMTWG